MNNADEIDKIVLDKLGGYSEEPAPGFFESVMFTREREQRNLKVKRILLIAGAAVLLAISAYVLFKTVFSAQGSSNQNNQPNLIDFSVNSEKTEKNNSKMNSQTEVWPDSRQNPDFSDINPFAPTPGMLWFTNQNFASANTNKSNLHTHSHKATPLITKNNTANTSKTNTKIQQPTPTRLSNNLRAYFTFETNTKGEVKFKNESEADEKATYTWYFGDGKSEDGADASHQYTQNGIYHTCLTVIDSKGKYDSYCTDFHCTENFVVSAPSFSSFRGSFLPLDNDSSYLLQIVGTVLLSQKIFIVFLIFFLRNLLHTVTQSFIVFAFSCADLIKLLVAPLLFPFHLFQCRAMFFDI